ncbi:LuxR family transcriptional regulator [Actinomadura barringtoniae]|uniref:LuxR family transcriptional regulator n=1 Tax=Actinomadura barringtoniae TaxID=1427535 RepID=A0A939PUA6_9ACTN|nr:LuxR C-terminal-related transcriptional regulator [Actinomadura barringtoniae]MBO2455164.1 LuxR family transcriptional regulator [Actinomadura barringtoniae]
MTLTTIQGLTGDLPQETTGFVGRGDELTALATALDTSRIVTVLGPGGVGKTRLALRTAAMEGARYEHGVVLAELSGLRDPDLLPGTLAALLGIPENDSRTPLDAVIDYLRDRHTLIVLDTCEHLVEACGSLADTLLRATPRVSVLATSRQPLDAPGERVLPVDPLPIDARDGGDAVELFEQRAAEVVAGFAVDGSNHADVVRLCRRLDGIPLAIELAAVRLRALPLEVLAARIDQKFRLLTGNRNSRVERHATLGTAIEWSYDLCTEQEKLLWARLGVFAGTFDIESVEQVCAGGELPLEDVLEALVNLVDKSVIQRVGGAYGDRYRMLDTIREFGVQMLAATEDELQVRERHLDRFTALAEEYGEHTFDTDQMERTHTLNRDHENLRVALEYAVSRSDGDKAAALSGGLWCYWLMIGRLTEGRYWQTKVLEQFPEPCKERSWALNIRAHLAIFQGDPAVGVVDAKASAEVARQIGDPWLEGRGQMYVMFGYTFLGDHDTAAAAEEITARLLEPIDSPVGLSLFYGCRAYMYLQSGRLDKAVADNERSLEMIGAGSGERWMQSYNYFMIGVARFLQGEAAACTAAACVGLRMKHEIGDPVGTAYCLELLAWLAADAGRPERATWLLGTADVLWRRAGKRLSGQPRMEAFHEQATETIHQALDEVRYQELWRAGAARELELVIASAEADSDKLLSAVPGSSVRDDSTVLTRREYEVARLAAQGMSNREIAQRLVISKRTADAHMEHILAKLGISRRAHIRDRLDDFRPDED